MVGRIACAFVVLFAFTFAEGLWTGFSRHRCAEDCPDDPGQCPPTAPDDACTCAPHVGSPVPLPDVVAVAAVVTSATVTFAEIPQATPAPDPREILHVPLLG